MASISKTKITPEANNAIIEFMQACWQLGSSTYNYRSNMEAIDKAYHEEQRKVGEGKRAKNKYNDRGNYDYIADLELGVVYPHVEAAVQFHSEVFLSELPMFGTVSPPEYADAALEMDAILEEQQLRGSWYQEMEMFFRDGEKYNFHGLEAVWERDESLLAKTDVTTANQDAVKPEVVVWAGNKIRRLDPYNTIVDPRVPLSKVHERGEFAGYVDIMGKTEVKQWLQNAADILPYTRDVLESSYPQDAQYYIPQVHQDMLRSNRGDQATDWYKWGGLLTDNDDIGLNYGGAYEIRVLYARIIPEILHITNVPAPRTVQIWKFVAVNGVLIYANKLNAVHNYLPTVFGQPYNDGLNAQSKSLAQRVKPYQDLSTSLVVSLMMSRRRAISDRTYYNPSKIAAGDMNSSNPSANIPVRNISYTGKVSDAIHIAPFHDTNHGHIHQDLGLLQNMANQLTGNNPSRQGQFISGNKTRAEFDQIMGASVAPHKRTARMIESQVFGPLKEILKLNILFYQKSTNVFHSTRGEIVRVDPTKIREATLQFKMTDGLRPADKQISADVLQYAFNALASAPALAQGYQVTPLFSYLIKTQGGDLRPFEKSQEQMAYEQAVGAWQQQAALAAEKGIQFAVPMPTPEQYGYKPGQAGNQQTADQQAAAQQEVKVNNIINNIQNNEQ